jgi:high frequency lysogenization protein
VNTDPHARTLALAGVFQAARLAQELAYHGQTDATAYTASVQSILHIDAPDTPTVYGGAAGVTLGLTMLRDRLIRPGNAADMEALRYVLAMLQLERSLAARRGIRQQLGDGLAQIATQMRFFEGSEDGDSGVHPRLVEKLAALYTQTISTLKPRIMVSGEPGLLNTPALAARVRAALLAGIRSAVLWRQLGGRRWQLLFTRRHLSAQAGQILRGHL